MALVKHPTKTQRIEQNWNRDITKRWALFTTSVTDRLRQLNKIAVVFDPATALANAEEIFSMNAGQQRIYMSFLQQEIERLLMGTQVPPNWQATYQIQAYQQGIDSTRQALISQGADIVPTAQEILQAADLGDFTATPSLGTGPAIPTAPIHRDALEFLYSRSYESLDGWTDKMATEVRGILFDGASEGKGIAEIVREMVKRIDVSKSRAQLIARTETIQAFQRSNTNETSRASAEIGKPILLRWLTSRDTRVRHLHREWHGTLATPKQNLIRISESPWNCRCAQAPVIPRANNEKNTAKFAKQRKELLAMGSFRREKKKRKKVKKKAA